MRSPEQISAACGARLERFRGQVPSFVFACLGTVDGRAFAFASAEGNDPKLAQRMSAISCSLLALSESFARESLRSNCNHALAATEHGNIIVVRVPCRSRAYILSVGADSTDNQAITLRRALDLASDLALLIDDWS
jgi:hypothetical protein